MIRSTPLLVLMAVTALASGACKKKPPVVVPTASGDSSRVAAPPTRTESGTPAPTGNNSAEMERKIAMARSAMLAPVYFEYDADDLRDDARGNLDEKVRIMTANPQLRVRISGHTDERGSDEYNIALGRRRAETAKRYLTDRGIDASRIETTTLGREQPAVPGSSEEAWAKNRRDEFAITAGGDQLRAP